MFEAKGVQIDGWGRDKFINNTLLYSPDAGYCVDDTVVFKVEITVFGELEIIPHAGNSSGNTPMSLSQCMRRLLETEDEPDIELVCTSNQPTSSTNLDASDPTCDPPVRLKAHRYAPIYSIHHCIYYTAYYTIYSIVYSIVFNII